jgi:hypothetical protein
MVVLPATKRRGIQRIRDVSEMDRLENDPEKRIGQCVAKVQDYGYGRLHVEIPLDMLHRFDPGMEVEVIEVRKKTVIADGRQ